MSSQNIILIMAGGDGKRMNSELPKVLHSINNKPMIVSIIETAEKLKPLKIGIIVGKHKDIITKTLKNVLKPLLFNKLSFIIQNEPLGTGHAIQCSKDFLILCKNTLSAKNVIILSGDVPLITSSTINNTLEGLLNSNISIIVSKVENPYGLGRIITDTNNNIIKIVEEKDCNDEEKKINLINTGIYSFKIEILLKWLHYIKNNNNQKEYYLTDIISIIKENELGNINMYLIPEEKNFEVIGVNTKQQLLNLQDIISIQDMFI